MVVAHEDCEELREREVERVQLGGGGVAVVRAGVACGGGEDAAQPHAERRRADGALRVGDEGLELASGGGDVLEVFGALLGVAGPERGVPVGGGGLDVGGEEGARDGGVDGEVVRLVRGGVAAQVDLAGGVGGGVEADGVGGVQARCAVAAILEHAQDSQHG